MLNDKLTVKEKDSRLAEIEDECFLQKQVESWNGKHIARWIEGSLCFLFIVFAFFKQDF